MVARATIVAPTAQPPRYGIIAAAPVIEDASWRWSEGWQFDPECPHPDVSSITDCGDFSDTIDLDRPPANVDGDPFVVIAGEECSAFGYAARDWQGRARRALEATQSYSIANELWLGGMRDLHSLNNTALADVTSDTLTNGAVGSHEALARVEFALGRCLYGRRGMVHVSPGVLVYLVENGVVTQQGGVWLTPMGNIVVADAGYPGTEPGGGVPLPPAGSNQWIIGTSMLTLRLGPVEVVGGPDSAYFSYSDNLVRVWAYRPVAVVWDECCHVAAETDVTVPLLAGAS